MGKSDNVGGLILAGGQARRLGGGDKPLYTLAGRSILSWQMESLNNQQSLLSEDWPLSSHSFTLALNTNSNPALFAGYDIPLIPDEKERYSGPMAGVLAGLNWAHERGFKALLTVPGDCPFLPRDLLTRLFAQLEACNMAAICAHSDKRDHVLTCLWDVSYRSDIQSILETGERRAKNVLNTVGYRTVEWPGLPYDPFLNINTPDDIKTAERVIAQHF